MNLWTRAHAWNMGLSGLAKCKMESWWWCRCTAPGKTSQQCCIFGDQTGRNSFRKQIRNAAAAAAAAAAAILSWLGFLTHRWFSSCWNDLPLQDPIARYHQMLFAQTMHLKLALPQPARLSIFFSVCSVVLHLCEGHNLRCTTDGIIKRRENPAHGKIWTHDLSVTRPLCYNRCPRNH